MWQYKLKNNFTELLKSPGLLFWRVWVCLMLEGALCLLVEMLRTKKYYFRFWNMYLYFTGGGALTWKSQVCHVTLKLRAQAQTFRFGVEILTWASFLSQSVTRKHVHCKKETVCDLVSLSLSVTFRHVTDSTAWARPDFTSNVLLEMVLGMGCFTAEKEAMCFSCFSARRVLIYSLSSCKYSAEFGGVFWTSSSGSCGAGEEFSVVSKQLPFVLMVNKV